MRAARGKRTIGAALAVPIPALVVTVILGVASPAATAATSTAQLERQFLGEINAVRVDHRLQPVRLDGRLREGARRHSEDMIRRAYFGHGRFMDRIAATGAPGNWVGEVLGWMAKSPTPVRAVVLLWLHSPEHRAILLDRRYALAGTGISRGTFKGFAETIVVTVDLSGWWTP
jgi:uncharacterized protein YkwD